MASSLDSLEYCYELIYIKLCLTAQRLTDRDRLQRENKRKQRAKAEVHTHNAKEASSSTHDVT